MSVFDYFRNVFNNDYSASSTINPASGLPMVGGIDISGNPFGMNNHLNSPFNSPTSYDYYNNHYSSYSSYDPFRGY